MRTLNSLDYSIIATYTLLCFAVGFYFTKRASKSTEEYFVGGRVMPWWLLGISMAATNFSVDTPLAVTKFIFQEGIAGCWFFWAGAIQVMVSVFLFAQLWRRSKVLTDVEIVERRYGGKPASFLRIFKGVYFGVIFNCIVMGWVYKGLIKIMTGVTNLNTTEVLIIFTAIVVIYTFASGFHGVVWTDFLQYFLAIAGGVALAWFAVMEVGGLELMYQKLGHLYGKESGLTALYPTWPQAAQWMPLSVFMTYLFIQWWAHKFADGGGKHIQRMSSAKNERHAVFGTFLFAILNFVIQIWPWILTALAALVIFGRDMKDPEMAYPMMMAKVLPSGMLGLVVVAAIAAFMSTISTHVNLGSSYMINDIYRRFLVKRASEKHYVFAARIATLLTLLCSIGVAMNIHSIGNTWKFLIAFTSGAGLTWILRWFWWRVNAWSEFSAMTTSGIATIIVELTHPKMLFSYKMWIIIGISTAVWLVVTFLTKPVDDKTLKNFVATVGPARAGWKRIYDTYGLQPKFKLQPALISWALGLVFLFSLNFGLGNVLLLNITTGLWQLAVAVIIFAILVQRIFKQTAPELKPIAVPAETIEEATEPA
ncbi:MAG: sodium:solute symporter family protein [Deltaproteobacteria bacterium]|nr:sodium:solute symporter family protein [Deltaproteobacteria bacterium]